MRGWLWTSVGGGRLGVREAGPRDSGGGSVGPGRQVCGGLGGEPVKSGEEALWGFGRQVRRGWGGGYVAVREAGQSGSVKADAGRMGYGGR